MKLKRINIAVVSLSILCLIAYIFIADDFGNIIKIIHSVNPMWILLALLFMAAYWVIEAIILHVVMKKLHPTHRFSTSLKTSMIGQFYNSVTPFASGGQPMQAVYMVKKGMPLGVASSGLVVKLITYQIIIAMYLIVMVIFKYREFSSQIFGLAYPIIIGLIVNICVTSFSIFLCCFKGFAIKAAEKFIGALSKTRLIKHPDSILKYIEEEIGKFYDSFEIIKKNPWMMVKLCALAALQLTVYFIIPYFIYRSFGLNKASIYSIMASQVFVLNISYFVPMPGAIGGAEVSFYAFSQLFFPWEVLNLSILLWRLITYYANIIVGGMFSLNLCKVTRESDAKTEAAASSQ